MIVESNRKHARLCLAGQARAPVLTRFLQNDSAALAVSPIIKVVPFPVYESSPFSRSLFKMQLCLLTIRPLRRERENENTTQVVASPEP